MHRLKPCPFCGNPGTVTKTESVSWRNKKAQPRSKYMAQCSISSCPGHHGKAYVNEKTAINKWNTRVAVIPFLNKPLTKPHKPTNIPPPPCLTKKNPSRNKHIILCKTIKNKWR